MILIYHGTGVFINKQRGCGITGALAVGVPEERTILSGDNRTTNGGASCKGQQVPSPATGAPYTAANRGYAYVPSARTVLTNSLADTHIRRLL